jgi:type I restriction enzyme, S subunit
LIWAFFESGEFLVQLGALSAGTGLTHIHLEHFRSFLLRRPPIDEQKLIFRIISKQQDLLSSATSGLYKLLKQKTALMQDLLTGKKRVTAC